MSYHGHEEYMTIVVVFPCYEKAQSPGSLTLILSSILPLKCSVVEYDMKALSLSLSLSLFKNMILKI